VPDNWYVPSYVVVRQAALKLWSWCLVGEAAAWPGQAVHSGTLGLLPK
jgi:hypothetical protein